MRTLETKEVAQVSGGLLGLKLNVLNLVKISARVDLDDKKDRRGRYC
ncbi:hypothetical protein PMI04_018110 [Sphingobium sp. AP49]|nr:hypothetical protein [Sphingobium sp. AP49]WHO38439.1 hypothetical protein PMI04_018110 [Sphingobium sp. AP49]